MSSICNKVKYEASSSVAEQVIQIYAKAWIPSKKMKTITEKIL